MAQCERELVGPSMVIRPRGKFHTDDAVALIGKALADCAGSNVRCVVVNWSGVESINSSGLGIVIKGETAIAKQGGHYSNCVFSKFMIDLIPGLKMVYDWNYFETEEQAMRSCPEVRGEGVGGDTSAAGSPTEGNG